MRRTVTVLAAMAICCLFISVSVTAEVPRAFTYQGLLTKPGGQPVVDGSYNIKFGIYTTASGGSPFWAETLSVNTLDGRFSVLLGQVHPLSLVILSTPDRWMGLAVGSDPELSPRMKMGSAPFAIKAVCADTAYVAGSVIDGAVTTYGIANGTILFSDIAQNGAAPGQVMKWSGTAWQAANDATGGGTGDYLPLSGGTMIGPINSTGNPPITMGFYNFGEANYIANPYGANNVGGYADTIGITASGSVIAGGRYNHAEGISTAIVGGEHNRTWDYSFVGGGTNNQAGGSWGFIGGGSGNRVESWFGFVGGGTHNESHGEATAVVGGRYNVAGNIMYDSCATVVGGAWNRAAGRCAFVGGGLDDSSGGDYTFIGGGRHNRATDSCAVVCGGDQNQAKAPFSMVLGGSSNTAAGWRSLAAGFAAKANHNNSFVWGDGSPANYYSDRNDQAKFRVNGGFQIDFNGYSAEFYNTGANVLYFSNTARLTTGGTWTNASDRNLKENFSDVDGEALLEKLEQLPITEWNYKSEADEVKHIGPTAQDFAAAFGVGNDTTSISTIDPSGIALAAIKALRKENNDLKAQNSEMQKQIDDLKKAVASLANKH